MDSRPVLVETMPKIRDIVSSGFSPWSYSGGKRLFDLCLTVPLLFLSLPVMLAAAVLVKCTSPGPILFRQDRVGRNGIIFQVMKFRTMIHDHRSAGPGVTQHGDPRIFPVGRWLRKWKFDELPQFFNVVRGEMSLVGPRPDLPVYLDRISTEQRLILSVRPGIVGSATLKYRHEEVLLADVPANELTEFYVSRILPEKIRIDMDYARQASLFSDINILVRTMTSIIS